LRASDKIGDFANFALSEAIQKAAKGWICVVARAPRNDDCTAVAVTLFEPESGTFPRSAAVGGALAFLISAAYNFARFGGGVDVGFRISI
jgi:hypothetical protein